MGNMIGSIVQSASAGLQAIVGNNAIDKASNAQVNAQKDANAFAQKQWDQTQAYLSPYREQGQNALNTLMAQYGNGGSTFNMSNFYQDPGYQFRLAEGQKALERSGAARGMTLSGAQAKALNSYGQGMASQEYQNAYNRFNTDQNNMFSRLYSLANMGLSASNGTANLSNAYSNNMANGITALGDAQAAGTMAKYRNWQTQDSRAAGAWSGNNNWSDSSQGFGMGGTFAGGSGSQWAPQGMYSTGNGGFMGNFGSGSSYGGMNLGNFGW